VSAPSSGFSGQVLNMHSGKQEVVLFHAKAFDDAAKAANELRNKRAVILNMENVDKALTRRVVDFLSGCVYALDGQVKKIAQSTYLFCPHSMDIVGDLETFRAEAENQPFEIVAETAFTADGKTDFSAQLQTLKDSGCELVFTPFYYNEATIVVKQAADMGL
jgi:FtsZ-interacting cell division protein YlmF